MSKFWGKFDIVSTDLRLTLYFWFSKASLRKLVLPEHLAVLTNITLLLLLFHLKVHRSYVFPVGGEYAQSVCPNPRPNYFSFIAVSAYTSTPAQSPSPVLFAETIYLPSYLPINSYHTLTKGKGAKKRRRKTNKC